MVLCQQDTQHFTKPFFLSIPLAHTTSKVPAGCASRICQHSHLCALTVGYVCLPGMRSAGRDSARSLGGHSYLCALNVVCLTCVPYLCALRRNHIYLCALTVACVCLPGMGSAGGDSARLLGDHSYPRLRAAAAGVCGVADRGRHGTSGCGCARAGACRYSTSRGVHVVCLCVYNQKCERTYV